MARQIPVTDLLSKVHQGTASEQDKSDLADFYQNEAWRYAASRILDSLKHHIDDQQIGLDAVRSALSELGKPDSPPPANRNGFRTLIFAIIQHKAAKAVRAARAQKRDVRETQESSSDDGTEGTPDLEVTARETGQLIGIECLNEPSVERQLVNVLGHLGGYSAASIARILHESDYKPPSLSSISLCLQQARQRIAKLLGLDSDQDETREP